MTESYVFIWGYHSLPLWKVGVSHVKFRWPMLISLRSVKVLADKGHGAGTCRSDMQRQNHVFLHIGDM